MVTLCETHGHRRTDPPVANDESWDDVLLTGPQITVQVRLRVVPPVTGLPLVHGGQRHDFVSFLVEVPPETGQRGAQPDDEQALLSGHRYHEADVFVCGQNHTFPSVHLPSRLLLYELMTTYLIHQLTIGSRKTKDKKRKKT